MRFFTAPFCIKSEESIFSLVTGNSGVNLTKLCRCHTGCILKNAIKMGHIIAPYCGSNVDDAHIGTFQKFLRPFYPLVRDVLGNGTSHILFEKVDQTGIAVCRTLHQVGFDRNVRKVRIRNLQQKSRSPLRIRFCDGYILHHHFGDKTDEQDLTPTGFFINGQALI